MNTEQQEQKARRLVKVVLDNAFKRLSQIKGDERNALHAEYKEWLIDPCFNDEVWFSTYKKSFNHEDE